MPSHVGEVWLQGMMDSIAASSDPGELIAEE